MNYDELKLLEKVFDLSERAERFYPNMFYDWLKAHPNETTWQSVFKPTDKERAFESAGLLSPLSDDEMGKRKLKSMFNSFKSDYFENVNLGEALGIIADNLDNLRFREELQESKGAEILEEFGIQLPNRQPKEMDPKAKELAEEKTFKKNFVNTIKIQKTINDVSAKLEGAKTKYNSSQYENLMNKVNALSGFDKAGEILLKEDKELKATLAKNIAEIRDLAVEYMEHKGKDGIKENAYPKMDAVIELYDYCQTRLGSLNPKLAEHTRRMSSSQIQAEYDLGELKGGEVDKKRNLYLCRFAPNEAKAKKWLDQAKNVEKTKKVEEKTAKKEKTADKEQVK